VHLTVMNAVAIVTSILISILFAIFVFGVIAAKAGYPRWYGLVMAFPFLNIVALYLFAYSTWPIEAQLLELQFRAGTTEARRE
jgi:hypothetical protein